MFVASDEATAGSVIENTDRIAPASNGLSHTGPVPALIRAQLTGSSHDFAAAPRPDRPPNERALSRQTTDRVWPCAREAVVGQAGRAALESGRVMRRYLPRFDPARQLGFPGSSGRLPGRTRRSAARTTEAGRPLQAGAADVPPPRRRTGVSRTPVEVRPRHAASCSAGSADATSRSSSSRSNAWPIARNPARLGCRWSPGPPSDELVS